jgi:hypothetical protein
MDDKDQSPEGAKAIYYDCAKATEQGSPMPRPAFLINTKQWFGTSGILSGEDFGELVQWGIPRTVTNSNVFKNGVQGILNFVITEQWRAGRIRLMSWAWPELGQTARVVQSLFLCCGTLGSRKRFVSRFAVVGANSPKATRLPHITPVRCCSTRPTGSRCSRSSYRRSPDS